MQDACEDGMISPARCAPTRELARGGPATSLRRAGRALTLIALAIAMAVSGCTAGADDVSPAELPPDTVLHTQIHMHATTNDDSLFDATPEQTVAVTIGDLSFDPVDARAALGSLMEIDLANLGALDHDFTIEQIDVDQAVRRSGDVPAGHEHMDQYAVHVPLGPKQSARLRLYLHAPGSYEFFCTVPGHREAGMQGILVVD